MRKPCDIGADAFRWHKGLGKSAWRVWCALDPSAGISASRLADALPTTPSTARRNLRRLETYDLAVRDAEGLWRRGPGELDVAAKHLGTLGAGEEQRELHAAQRYVYRVLRRQHRLRGIRIPRGGR